jgi:hypothetical protein
VSDVPNYEDEAEEEDAPDRDHADDSQWFTGQ